MTTLPQPLDVVEDSLATAIDDLARRLPEPLRPLAQVAYNYRWSWTPGAIDVFMAVDPGRWHAVHANPVRLLVEASPTRLEAAADDQELVARIAALAEELDDDLARPSMDDFDPSSPVTFLCAEFGVHESMPLYSGGLGVLAGDILKEASDLALPMVAVGLFYRNGYFQQRLDASGWQVESWQATDPALSPIVPLRRDGEQVTVTVPIRGTEATARAWVIQVGRVPLLLLDTDLPENSPAARWTTARLYDGNDDVRLAQYATLGIGAVRLLDRLGVEPSLLHLNEGHAALAAVELIAQRVADGADFDTARDAVRDRCVFTTHTPVAAGNETYPPDVLVAALPGLGDRLGIGSNGLLNLGRIQPGDPHEPAGMTPMAMRLARNTNGVAKRHGEVARGMWQPLFGGEVEDVPIGHVTNGVHLPTWMGNEFRGLLDTHLAEDWWRRADDPATWEPVADIPAADLWAARTTARASLVRWAREVAARDRLRRGDTLEWAELGITGLSEDALTLGFARRVAGYKRLYLLTRDVDRMARLMGGDQPVQLLIAGKAHPKDDGAKAMVRDLFANRGRPELAERVFFLEDYDIEIGRRLTAGCDVWVNVPRPPMEASGTSGMKVVLNGGLNLSVLDGWWAEGYDGTNGWGIDGAVDDDHGRQDHEHAMMLYDLLEQQVVPTFHDRDDDGIPQGWVAMMRSSLQTLGPQFCASRMMHDYAGQVY
ncbi:alpha-glucan family phosphorylase [Salsipaludibacter albus]|uniref:alpha-glucan family phosphorylase n=1 Tax=Salsipaludibacter albus TaxID=2849650 RepID=UPI001EE43D47|nr:alpha-glucan family phosphorylase [Salsipaludibacter albus]MBY5162472.1 alpha-glucan family phosphorylase [Salsipaludibacter albus]